MSAWYNEIDPYAAQWLRNLIANGLIAHGDVDERSILDVRADDLRGYTQCHFFAGIGGWPRALRLAGWDDARPVWTGSCPCQPFSAAGAGKAADDGRHLWPAWFPLIRECRPAIIFGEQVEAAIGWGWLDLVFADLESQGYACGATVLPACGVGAPHIRQRLWFVADSVRGHACAEGLQRGGQQRLQPQDGGARDRSSGAVGTGLVADGVGAGLEVEREQPAWDQCAAIERGGAAGRLGNAESIGCRWRTDNEDEWRRQLPSSDRGPWDSIEWLPCTDGKARPAQPGIFPLAHGISARVAKLRAIGNAIVPQVAAEFIGRIPPAE